MFSHVLRFSQLDCETQPRMSRYSLRHTKKKHFPIFSCDDNKVGSRSKGFQCRFSTHSEKFDGTVYEHMNRFH